MLIQTAELDANQLLALDALCVECQHYDGNAVAIYRHLLATNRGRPSSMLLYEKGHLIGFLAAFFFHDNACELSILVKPEQRHRGIATQLFNAVLPLLQLEQVHTLAFSSPHGLNDHWLPKMGLSYQNTEYQMHRVTKNKILVSPSSLCIRTATHSDILALSIIDKACFPDDAVNTIERMHGILTNIEQTLFVIIQENMPIGKALLNWQSRSVRLTDVAILPEFQGLGFGSALLAYCINHAVTAKHFTISLDVETTNKPALGLYTRLGFKISNAYDYWQNTEFGLTDFLHHL